MKPKALWQISISISREAEEAAGNLLEAWSGQQPSTYTDMETGAIAVTVYLEKLEQSSRSVRAELSKKLGTLKDARLEPGKPVIGIKKLRAENWAESWKRHFKPLQIGRSLLIKPSWSKRKARPGQALVVLDPGLSFGTGQHATTAFCLQRLAALRRAGVRQSFLDIGSGSGILAISAAKLGYAPVEAFDFDPEAVRISRENAVKNRVPVKPRRQDLTELPMRSSRKYDVVCANLIFDLLIAQAGKISQRVKPSGHLILAGILHTQFEEVRRAYEAEGWELVSSREEKEWESGEFIRRSA